MSLANLIYLPFLHRSRVPDYQHASRVVVKDYSEGKLLYCHSPPPIEDNTRWIDETDLIKAIEFFENFDRCHT